MIRSMTAFATRTGTLDGASWAWEMRGVNARGLDIRTRLPEGIDGLESVARSTVSKSLTRGNITLNLRMSYDDTTGGLAMDAAQLDNVLAALGQIEQRAFDMGVTLAQPTAADVLTHRGVILQGRSDAISDNLIKALKDDVQVILTAFIAMRETEGQALRDIIERQLSEISAFVDAADSAALQRKDEARVQMAAALTRVIEDVADADPDRIAQELALIAVKQDVTEEIDRLRAHVVAARDLLDTDIAVGRKLDFLAQEFNREANTLCSKAQSKQLTAIGLDLKACIDQMREQIQNVE